MEFTYNLRETLNGRLNDFGLLAVNHDEADKIFIDRKMLLSTVHVTGTFIV